MGLLRGFPASRKTQKRNVYVDSHGARVPRSFQEFINGSLR